MNVFNYLRILGAFTNAKQAIEVSVEPSDRQERKMLEDAMRLIHLAWSRREERLIAQQEKSGEDIDIDAERRAFFPVAHEGKLRVPLQFLQDYMVRRIAGVQTNASIHSIDQVRDLREVFDEYGVKPRTSFESLVLDGIRWTDRQGQKPKVLVHVHKGERQACIRFEAAQELAQKFLIAAQGLSLTPGSVFDLEVSAQDPAVERNRAAGKTVMETGRYVNHNLRITANGAEHTGRPPKGVRFLQKPTLEQMERLFNHVQSSVGAV